MDQCTTYDFLYQKYLSGMKPIIPGALMRKEDFIGMISSELQDFCLIVIDEEFYKRGFMMTNKAQRKEILIETERLVIAEFTMDMAQIVQENSVDEDNKRFVPDEVWETVEETEETLKFLISQYGSFDGPLVYPIIVKATKDNIGYVQLCPIDDGNWEIGYHIAKKYTGNGYATEAVKAFLPVIARQVNISEIYGICLAENVASIAVMRKCGFENIFKGIGLYQGAEREIVKNVWKA